ncbi:RNA-binding protein [Marinomonas sp. SBI22]|uniref:helix-hairpin-helix domain-containing protein n=1 Tax=unclassified Marinomonas TaxID=196814 RepID=UPI0007AF785E|nr:MULTISPECIES: Tex family protein [unclassified Marinomonas]KZM43156.1 RNA-binding protein [Marinomonas sp. SBI22]KZM44727.1 RNA-binding protein [Marinomonas sp. SBI8L]
MFNLENQLAKEFNISVKIVKNTLSLINEGASIPFIARYRKDQTQGLSDIDLRNFQIRQKQLQELENNKIKLIEKLTNNKQLTSELKNSIQASQTKKQLEEIYAPYKSTKLSVFELARNLDFETLALESWNHWTSWNDAKLLAHTKNIDENISLENAKTHIINLISEPLLLTPDFIQACETYIYNTGMINSRVIRGKKEAGEKYRDYFDYSEAIKSIPSHRALALFRGKKEGFIKLALSLSTNEIPRLAINFLNSLNLKYTVRQNRTSFIQEEILNQIWLTKVLPKIESNLLLQLKDKAENEASNVFSQNLKALLMAAPAGNKRIMALDPGFKNGVKIAVIDEQGNFLKDAVIYPHPPQNKKHQSEETLINLIKNFRVSLIALGNGTASRETDKFLNDLIKRENLDAICVTVSESGASIYSASEIASKEFPDLDVTIRGAISIARRLQDPLSELIKIDPESIGVGQYQHDIKTSRLKEALNIVIEDCVNKVGVDLNSASASLLEHISGLSPSLANNIVTYRNAHGSFTNRSELKQVKGIGNKSFEHCAGFLRIQTSNNPLDASGVHPESYPLVAEIATKLGSSVKALISNTQAIDKIKSLRSEFPHIDNYTFEDILLELAKPGRDPRPEFKYAKFDQGIEKISDLVEGKILEGVATNIAAFGVFVDIGVHQDGLVHISQLANRFVKDPASLVKVGDILKVEVLDVDEKRKRISLKAIGL